ncbi:MAG: helix-turn-helix domain-containing protein [Caulobacterales bacterium]
MEPSPPRPPQTPGEHLRAARTSRRLLQRDVARQMGVCTQSVLEWESGKSLSITMWPKLIRFLGYDPIRDQATLGAQIAALRRCLGLSLNRLGRRLGCDEETVAHWESNRRMPNKLLRDALEKLFAEYEIGATR